MPQRQLKIKKVASTERTIEETKTIEYEALKDGFAITDSLHSGDTTLMSLSYITAKEINLETIVTKGEEVAPIKEAIKQAENIQTDVAYQAYLNTLDQVLIDQNTKTVELMYTGKVAKGVKLDWQDVQNLYTIANQCPLSGGKGVYGARSLINTVVNENWEDEERCLLAGYNVKRQEAQSALASLGMNIYPNPAKDKVYIELLDFDGKYLLELYNVLGQKVFEKEVKAKITELKVVDLTKGLYHVRLVNKGTGSSFEQKIVVK